MTPETRGQSRTTKKSLPNIHPYSSLAALDRSEFERCSQTFPVDAVAPLVGMSPAFVRRVVGPKKLLEPDDILALLDQDTFAETFVPRSGVLRYLKEAAAVVVGDAVDPVDLGADEFVLRHADARDALRCLAPESVQCVVTSTPYWGMRVYKESRFVAWADGEVCPYGHEQTPEAFVRHTVQILHELRPVLAATGSIWWNVMDTFNTRTPVRGNAYEAMLAMQGRAESWDDHEARRYSAGHSYLKDGEQCMIPAQIAERAGRIGYFVKSVITWAKPFSTPEPQNSRVSRMLEYVIHLSKVRAPKFNKSAYRETATRLGGRNSNVEADKLSDVWMFPTSGGGNGHGAQFPIALPGRCIALSTGPGDVVLDPFVGSGNSGVAAVSLGRRFIGVDVSMEYLGQAERAIKEASVSTRRSSESSRNPVQLPLPTNAVRTKPRAAKG